MILAVMGADWMHRSMPSADEDRAKIVGHGLHNV
jgi:hypothetical protein